jgi:hypothetical protein
MATNKKAESLSDNLKQLAEIQNWFNSQKEIDIELGLEKVKIAAQLLKLSREKLNKLENEFKEIEKEFGQDSADLQNDSG